MKKFLILAPLLAVLAGCAPGITIPPATSVTGYWKGDITKFGMSVTIKAQIQRTDSPTNGDFTGTGQLRGVVSVDDAMVTGNVNSGTMVAQRGSDVVSCVGNFKNNNEYNGTCTYGSYSAPLYMYRQGD